MSALLLLMVDPEQCMWFLVFILALQQFDGNILGPKILGDSTGLSAFWVLVAIIVGGGLFDGISILSALTVEDAQAYLADHLLEQFSCLSVIEPLKEE